MVLPAAFVAFGWSALRSNDAESAPLLTQIFNHATLRAPHGLAIVQARRAAFSAAANIAEGSAKRGSKELRRFLDISIGSLAELAFILRLSRDLGFLSVEDWTRLDELRRRSGFLVWRLYQAISKKGRQVSS